MSTTLSDKRMFSNRELVRLTVPLFLSSLLSIVTNLVDSAMVSSAGEAAVAGVSLVGNITLVFIMLISAATSGGIVITSQFVGKGDRTLANESAKQFIYLATAAGLFISVILFFFREPILRLVYGSVDEDVFKACCDYLFWLSLGYPFYAIGEGSASILRAIGKNTLSVVLFIASNLLNVIGNAIFIFVFDMGAAGAGLSTTISRVVWAVGSLILLHNKSLKVHFEKLLHYKPDWSIIKKITVIGGTSGLTNALFYIGKLLISTLTATFPTAEITAFSVSNSICNFSWSGLGAFSNALVPIVGQCMGAGKPDQARFYTKRMSNASLVAMVILFGLTFIFRNQLVLMFDFGSETLALSANNVGIGAIFSIFSIYSWAFTPINGFRAAGDVKYGLYVSVVTMFVFRVGLAFLLGSYFKMGLLGLWIGMWADWFARAILNIIHFRRGKWLTKKVI
ncbi:MAG: MATE family efflux transporter [Oscillospiraceae bacterium]|nr:MATE family efflux transporter [Oscillospiraceae bacterium]